MTTNEARINNPAIIGRMLIFNLRNKNQSFMSSDKVISFCLISMQIAPSWISDSIGWLK